MDAIHPTEYSTENVSKTKPKSKSMSESGKVIESYNERINEAEKHYNFEKVIEILNELEEKVPTSKVVKVSLGVAHLYIADYENSIKYFEASMKCAEEEIDYDCDFYMYAENTPEHYIKIAKDNLEFERYQRENFIPKPINNILYEDIWDSRFDGNGDVITDDVVAVVEAEYGFKLPESYVKLMKFQNGGVPKKCEYTVKYKDDKIANVSIDSFKEFGQYDLDNHIAN